MSFRESLSLGLTDRCTVAAYVYVNTTNSGPNYTTSRDVTEVVTICRSQAAGGRGHFRCMSGPPPSRRSYRATRRSTRRTSSTGLSSGGTESGGFWEGRARAVLQALTPRR